MKNITKFGLAFALVTLAIGLTQKTVADAVLDWNTTFVTVATSSGDPPPVTGRKGAIIHAAIYDAVNGIARSRVFGPCQSSGAVQDLSVPPTVHTEPLSSFRAHRDHEPDRTCSSRVESDRIGSMSPRSNPSH